MGYKACIRKIATGEEVIRHYPDDDWDSAFFFWAEGNFSCDCNRHWEFERGRGVPEDELVDGLAFNPCGDRLFYTVPWIESSDGTRMQIDE